MALFNAALVLLSSLLGALLVVEPFAARPEHLALGVAGLTCLGALLQFTSPGKGAQGGGGRDK